MHAKVDEYGDVYEVPGINCDELVEIWQSFRSRHSDRDDRIDTLDKVVRGDLSVFDPDDEGIDSVSPNLVQVALEDTAEAAALVPSVRVDPAGGTKKARESADKMERIAAGYLTASKIDLMVPQTMFDLAGGGFAAWVVLPDPDQKLPLIERRDMRTCYPEPGWRQGDVVRRCIFARELYESQLPVEWSMLLRDYIYGNGLHVEEGIAGDHNITVTLIEYFDEEAWVTAGVFSSTGASGQVGGLGRTSGVSKHAVEFERITNPSDVCPVVIGQRNSFDGEARGQFDQVIGPFAAHVRLMGVVLDYADQAVYSDIWVKDLIGTMPWGGGAYIELGPAGQIGRVPPAVSSLDVQRDLQALQEAVHMGGRWPKSRPGDVDQAIASAKFVEATAGVMNTAIKQYHLTMKYMLEQSLRICFMTDKALYQGNRQITGVLRNKQFVEEYSTKAIDMNHRIHADYGLGLGRDAAQSAVLHLQYQGAGLISRSFVQENIEGVSDVTTERERIDVEQFRDMALAKMLEGLQAATIPERALIEIAKARRNGGDLFDLYEEYIVLPKEETMAGSMDPGLGGPPLMPGMGPEGMPMEVGPDGMPMPPGGMGGPPGMGGPEGGGMPMPPAPPAPDILARLGSDAGPGGKIGTQIMGPANGAA